MHFNPKRHVREEVNLGLLNLLANASQLSYTHPNIPNVMCFCLALSIQRIRVRPSNRPVVKVCLYIKLLLYKQETGFLGNPGSTRLLFTHISPQTFYLSLHSSHFLCLSPSLSIYLFLSISRSLFLSVTLFLFHSHLFPLQSDPQHL